MKKSLFLLVALAALTSCGGSDQSGSSESKTWEEVKATRTRITIYVNESHIYGPYVKGVDENVVEEAIAKKFFEDTGNAIKLDVIYETNATFNTNFGAVMSASSWDAAVNYVGQAGIEDTILDQDVLSNIDTSIRQNGTHLRETLTTDSWNSVTSINDEVIGIPAQMDTKQKGVLARKDYMRQVGYTESKAEADASNGTLKWVHTIDDFNDMIGKIKTSIPKVTTPISGPAYDIEFTLLAGCMDSTGYQYRSVSYDDDGKVTEVLPGWISKNYDKVLQQEYDWLKAGYWEADNTTLSNSKRLENLSAGKTAVYCADPSITNLINVVRQAKIADPTAEFVLLDPLAAVDENGDAIEDSGAFVEANPNYDVLIFNKKSKKTDLVIKYLDWMQSSKENYELCAYGIKGEHWEDSDIGEDYYEYADDYFVTHKPYSGVFTLVRNDSISNRIPMQYTETERQWISRVKSYKCLSDDTRGMLFYGCDSQTYLGFQEAEADFYTDVAMKAWAGTANPTNTYPTGEANYRELASAYIEWLTNRYKMYLLAR